MSEEPISVEVRVECVKMALARIDYYQQKMREINFDAGCGPSACKAAKEAMEAAVAEFSWQWRNVRAIFEEKGI